MSIEHILPDSCTSHHEALRLELEKIIGSSASALTGMLRYHMGWQDEQGSPCRGESGKLIRPALCLLSCQAVGGDISRVIPAAAALELIHNFSLIHDDIQDASNERHHRPTVWKLWGTPQAINAGDAMFALAYRALLGLRETGTADEKIAFSAKMLSMACLELCEGQCLDLQYENLLDVTVEGYLDMVKKKTAALLAVSASLGAYTGGARDELVDKFHLFGKELGIAFQIQDDIMGIWGMEEGSGKSPGDIRQRKKTLPVVYALQHGVGGGRERLEMLYGQESIATEDVPEVKRLLGEFGARDYAEDLAERHYCKALALLEATGLGPSKAAPLREMASFLLQRDF